MMVVSLILLCFLMIPYLILCSRCLHILGLFLPLPLAHSIKAVSFLVEVD
uniref:Uncharacterized protein n=1 Tax=Arundo donax TaxID=35708 RepID=A0A0A9G3F6_ARUDO